MSLTSQLDDPKSPVRIFMQKNFANLCLAGGRGNAGKIAALDYGFDGLTSKDLLAPVPKSVSSKASHSSSVGTAFDYRARIMLGGFKLEDSTAVAGVKWLLDLASQSPAFSHEANVLIEAIELSRHAETAEQLDVYSIVLAWGESLYRGGTLSLMGSTLGQRLERAKNGYELIRSIESEKLEDIAALRIASTEQIYKWKTEIGSGSNFDPNPTFTGSSLVGADGDWIIGDTLIECKTTELMSNNLIRKFTLQLLGYVLLDFEDAHAIRSVGVWMPRRGLFHSWSLDELITPLTVNSLPELRKSFQTDLEEWVEEERARYQS